MVEVGPVWYIVVPVFFFLSVICCCCIKLRETQKRTVLMSRVRRAASRRVEQLRQVSDDLGIFVISSDDGLPPYSPVMSDPLPPMPPPYSLDDLPPPPSYEETMLQSNNSEA